MPETLWTLPPELERYAGWWDWEQHLGDRDRYRLALTRSLIQPEDEESFALEYADLHNAIEFFEALSEAGEDKAARAIVRLETELDAYPYRLDWDAQTPEELQLLGSDLSDFEPRETDTAASP